MDVSSQVANQQQQQRQKQPMKMMSSPSLKRQHSLPQSSEDKSLPPPPASTGLFSRNRKSFKQQNRNMYETPHEEDELLDEAIASAHRAAQRLDQLPSNDFGATYQPSRPPIQQVFSDPVYRPSYPTPSHSKDMNNVSFGAHGYTSPTRPVDIPQAPQKYNSMDPHWPTPPYDESDWAAAAAASLFATQLAFR